MVNCCRNLKRWRRRKGCEKARKYALELPLIEKHPKKVRKQVCNLAQKANYCFDATGNGSRKILHLTVQRIKAPRTSRGFPFSGGHGPSKVFPFFFNISRKSGSLGAWAVATRPVISPASQAILIKFGSLVPAKAARCGWCGRNHQ
jgi:hypothetical protein